MKILFATVCNDEYALGCQVMLYSMKKNIKDFDKCDVKIYHNKIIAHLSNENQDAIKKISSNIDFEHIDKPHYYLGKLPQKGNRAEGCKAAYLTLESFREYDYDKVILFDVDMLCIGDISELFNSDIEFGIRGGNTGFVVLGKNYRTESIYYDLISMIPSHSGDAMDQGIINNYFLNVPRNLPRHYNDYPLHEMSKDSKILHWAHYDHIKPWVLDFWKDKVDLFSDVKPYPYPNKAIGNVPIRGDKAAFDLWLKYEKNMNLELE